MSFRFALPTPGKPPLASKPGCGGDSRRASSPSSVKSPRRSRKSTSSPRSNHLSDCRSLVPRSMVKPSPGDAFEEVKKSTDSVTWKVTAKRVALSRGKRSQFELRVANEDGQCLEPRSWLVLFQPPPTPAPRIELLDPNMDTGVEALSYHVRFRVESKAPLHRVQVFRNDQVVYDAEVAKLQTKDGWSDFEYELP